MIQYIVHIWGCQFINLKNVLLFCLKIFITFTNSVDPDEMQHYAAFHLGLHCLQNTSLEVSRIQRVKKGGGGHSYSLGLFNDYFWFMPRTRARNYNASLKLRKTYRLRIDFQDAKNNV